MPTTAAAFVLSSPADPGLLQGLDQVSMMGFWVSS